MKRIGLISLLLLSLPLIASAYVSPGKPTGFVNDFANVLKSEDKQVIEQKAQTVKNQTGAEIAIAIVPSLGEDSVEEYAVSLFEDWKIGQKEKDNGVLILLAMDSHDIKIETGYGAEGNLTDAQSKQIIEKIMVPAFRNNDFAGGLAGAVEAIGQTFATGEVSVTQPAGSFHFNLSPSFFIALMVLFQILISIMGRSKSWWLGGVLGGIGATVIGLLFGFLFAGAIGFLFLVPIGLLIDRAVSKQYAAAASSGIKPWWLRGGGRGPGGFGSGGGFGGFGGGSSGGGGASGKW